MDISVVYTILYQFKDYSLSIYTSDDVGSPISSWARIGPVLALYHTICRNTCAPDTLERQLVIYYKELYQAGESNTQSNVLHTGPK